MSREAREKSSFGTYYIKQIGSPDVNLFDNDIEREKFIEILKKAKNKFDFKLYAYCIDGINSYELVIFDNGSDISNIMKSINISYSIYKKTSGKLFKDRYKSKIIKDYYDLLNTTKEIHCLAKESKWNGCCEYTEENRKTSLLDIEDVLRVFNYKDMDSIDAYKNYLNEEISEEEILCYKDIVLCDNIRECIKTKKEAEKKLDNILNKKGYTFKDLIKNKEERNRMIKHFRKNSTLSLKEIGNIFGGLSESSICKILSK
ncbi:MAG: transposase [Bacillota bacterium]|nr:transposase [Bacillota bacterium]